MLRTVHTPFSLCVRFTAKSYWNFYQTDKGRNPLGELVGNQLETRVAKPGWQLVSNQFTQWVAALSFNSNEFYCIEVSICRIMKLSCLKIFHRSIIAQIICQFQSACELRSKKQRGEGREEKGRRHERPEGRRGVERCPPLHTGVMSGSGMFSCIFNDDRRDCEQRGRVSRWVDNQISEELSSLPLHSPPRQFAPCFQRARVLFVLLDF